MPAKLNYANFKIGDVKFSPLVDGTPVVTKISNYIVRLQNNQIQNYTQERVYSKSFTLLFIYRFQDPFTLTNTSGLKYSQKVDVMTGAVPKIGCA